jgi:hypothetical protein
VTEDDVTSRALNAAATAAHEAVLVFALRFDRREDYLPVEQLAARVQRRVLEAGVAACREAEEGGAGGVTGRLVGWDDGEEGR